MLQINSGKLYTRCVGRTNQLRGVLYSNLELCYGKDVPTAAGTLRETDGIRGNRAIVYEIEERIETAKVEPGILVSHTIAPFLTDFSALASFGLRAIVSPDPAVVERLTSTGPGLASYDPPSKFARRYFDEHRPLQDNEIAPFSAFVDQLIALDRKTFLAAMRAIRTFVTGLHRMRDDLALAYTLFVSAVESLAQEFDGYSTHWHDIDERKRKVVDKALARASARTRDGVREAILSTEHVSLARRYRAFVLKHVGGDYFRASGLVPGGAIARHELEEALKQAYALRSRYVHNIRELPDALTLAHGHREMAEVDRRPVLSFEGLIRLTHHVISAFVAAGNKVEREPYDYTLEQSGVAMVPLAPELWVGRPLRKAADARQRLEGHLGQIVSMLAGQEKVSITDLRPIYPDIERLAKSSGVANRIRLLTLYALFAALLSKDDRSESLDALLQQHSAKMSEPSNEALVMGTLFGSLDAWHLETHKETLENYFEERSKPGGLHAPKLLDAAMCLALAERYRKERDFDAALDWLGRAVETHPGCPAVAALETDFSRRKQIDWRSALLPKLTKAKRGRHTKQRKPSGGLAKEDPVPDCDAGNS